MIYIHLFAAYTKETQLYSYQSCLIKEDAIKQVIAQELSYQESQQFA